MFENVMCGGSQKVRRTLGYLSIFYFYLKIRLNLLSSFSRQFIKVKHLPLTLPFLCSPMASSSHCSYKLFYLVFMSLSQALLFWTKLVLVSKLLQIWNWNGCRAISHASLCNVDLNWILFSLSSFPIDVLFQKCRITNTFWINSYWVLGQ